MYEWSDYLAGNCDLVVVMGKDGFGSIFTPDIDRAACPIDCRACPKRIVQTVAEQGLDHGVMEMTRECDNRMHRVTFSKSRMVQCGSECYVFRIRTLDTGWDRLTDREKELVTITREHGWDEVPVMLGISPKTAWAHRRSIYAKCNLSSAADWHRFVLHNG